MNFDEVYGKIDEIQREAQKNFYDATLIALVITLFLLVEGSNIFFVFMASLFGENYTPKKLTINQNLGFFSGWLGPLEHIEISDKENSRSDNQD